MEIWKALECGADGELKLLSSCATDNFEYFSLA